MSKKPASLTSDLLARKGEAEPSPADPSSRVTLTAGRQPDLGGFGSGFGRPEGPPQGPDSSGPAMERPEMQGMDEEERPRPPEPEIIYTPEDYESGGRTRLVAGALVGLALIAGVIVALSLNGNDGVAPVSPDIVAAIPDAPQPAAAPSAPTEAAPVADTAVPKSATPAEAATPEAEPERPAIETAEAPLVPDSAAEPAAPAAAETTAVAEAPVAAPAAAPVPQTPAPSAAPATGGAFVVQLMAVREEAAARPAYEALQTKHAALLGGHALDIERADLGERGIFYRVRAAGFASRDAAVRTCASLKSAGQDCMVRPR